MSAVLTGNSVLNNMIVSLFFSLREYRQYLSAMCKCFIRVSTFIKVTTLGIFIILDLLVNMCVHLNKICPVQGNSSTCYCAGMLWFDWSVYLQMCSIN